MDYKREIFSASQLTKMFGHGEAEVHAVSGVDLTVYAGELVLVMGPSGSGKTTLLTMIGGLLRPTAGSIIVDGREITGMDEAQLTAVRRRTVGFVFQSFNLWESLSVRENVELALNIGGQTGGPARARATALLLALGLAHRLDFRSRDLSGGEKQRVSIARALANDPRLLLADEPTANLDSKHGHEVMQLLRRIADEGDRAVLVVSHDERIREVADRVLWLEDGRLRSIGRLVRDPVCGMAVEAERAVTLEHEGVTYSFCSRGCGWEFRSAPERYLGTAQSAEKV
ncbi:MAG TPA: ATP-binding cassette domain-containing protein [Dehalococcoidia bacterium]|nr:ATP-binding cassette domain-containing protein [Dehalococcoidia bacterium]